MPDFIPEDLVSVGKKSAFSVKEKKGRFPIILSTWPCSSRSFRSEDFCLALVCKSDVILQKFSISYKTICQQDNTNKSNSKCNRN